MSGSQGTESAAALWLVRRCDPDWSQADQKELDAWLAESADHRLAFWRLEFGEGRTNRLKALRSFGSEPYRAGAPSVFFNRIGLGVAVLATVIAMAVLAPMMSSVIDQRTYSTEIGGLETVPLADGTRVELNTATRLRTSQDEERRSVWLHEGEAYFDVAHDASRPFLVHVGERTVRVLGTKFSVQRIGERVEVSVVEGRVRIDERATLPPRILVPGDTAVFAEDLIVLGRQPVDQIEAALSWRRGVITFDQTPLSDVVAEFNRYNRTQMTVTDADTAAVRIGGSFEADNVDSFLRLLQRGLGLTVERTEHEVKISA